MMQRVFVNNQNEMSADDEKTSKKKVEGETEAVEAQEEATEEPMAARTVSRTIDCAQCRRDL